jgi:hypothetical protein
LRSSYKYMQQVNWSLVTGIDVIENRTNFLSSWTGVDVIPVPTKHSIRRDYIDFMNYE